jgi:hypothetical protein
MAKALWRQRRVGWAVAVVVVVVVGGAMVPQVRACLVDAAALLVNGELPGGG